MPGRPRRRARSTASERGGYSHDYALCGATTKSGGICRRGAGEGTDHPGVGRCGTHGGKTPSGIKAAGVTMARGLDSQRSVMTAGPIMGAPQEMEPVDALLWCVSICAGEVSYFTDQLQKLEEHELIERPETSVHEAGEGEKGSKDLRTETKGPAQLHLLIRERQRAVDRLAKTAKMALDAGVAERQVALAERQGDMIAHVLQAVLTRLGITPDRTPKTVARLEAIMPEVLLSLESPNTMVMS